MKLVLLLFFILLCVVPAQGQSVTEWFPIVSMTPTNDQIIVRWEGGIPPYKLQRRATTNSAWFDFTPHIYARFYAIPTNAETPFFYRVRTVADTVPPSVPSGLAMLTNSCDSITLSWAAAPCPDPRWCGDNVGGTGLRGYRIYRNGSRLRAVSAFARTNTDSGLLASRAYSYAVSAVDNAGNESAQGSPFIMRTAPCSITLAWDANVLEDVVAYILRWGVASGNYSEAVNVGKVLTYRIANLLPRTTYYFVVCSYDMLGLTSDASNEVSYTP